MDSSLALRQVQGRVEGEDVDTTSKSVLARTFMDGLTAFGFIAVSLMLLTYALEARSPWFVLAFAGSCALSSAYGFLAGTWPFGLVEAVWSLVAARRWWGRRIKRS